MFSVFLCPINWTLLTYLANVKENHSHETEKIKRGKRFSFMKTHKEISLMENIISTIISEDITCKCQPNANKQIVNFLSEFYFVYFY